MIKGFPIACQVQKAAATMPQLDIFVPGILFPAIPLLMSTIGARNSSLSALIRGLHDQLLQISTEDRLHWELYQRQIKSLRVRLSWNIRIQAAIGTSFLFNVLTLIALFANAQVIGIVLFGLVLLMIGVSIVFYMWELHLSVEALDVHLSDLEQLNPATAAAANAKAD